MQQDYHKSYRIVALISGRGSNLQAVLEYLEITNLPAEVVLVISSRAGVPGLSVAAARGIPTVVLDTSAGSSRPWQEQLSETLSDAAPDLIVLAGFMKVLPEDLISAFYPKIINIHPSLLPAFKGLHPHRQALAAGVKVAGCSVHLVSAEVDSGNILAQVAVPVLSGDTEATLAERVLKSEHLLLPRVIEGLITGDLTIVEERGSFLVKMSETLERNLSALTQAVFVLK